MNGIRAAREREARDRLKSNVLKEGGLKRKLGTGSSSAEVQSRRFLVGECKGPKGWEKRARVESEGKDVTPTAVAKEVIGLRPCARYPNRGRRREPTGHPAEGRRREGLSVDEGGDDWRRLSDAAPLSRTPPIREGVSRPFAGGPLLSSPRGEMTRAGVQQRWCPTPSKFECRITLEDIAAGLFSPPSYECERANVFAP